MKSLSQTSRQPERLRGEQSPFGLHFKHPLTDYHFQGAGSEMKSGGSSQKLTHPALAPGFRDLSTEFLAVENRRNYVAEVLFFAIIVGVSAWPIVSMVRALGEFLQ